MRTIPNAPAQLYRQGVVNHLQHAAKKGLVVVHAGAGYGKTTAVQQFLQSQQAPYIYITLKQVHNLIEVLWQEYLQRIEELFPAYRTRFESIGIPIDHANYTVFVRELRSIMHKFESFYCVLDDYHVLGDSPASQFVHNMILEQLPNVHIILITRTVEYIDMEGLQAAGLLSTVTEKQLAFTQQELTAYLGQRGASAREAALLHKRTEGWPFAVRLLYHTYQPGEGLENSMGDIQPFVHLQLEAEFFRKYSDCVQQALVRLSLPDLLHAPMVHLLEGANCPEVRDVLWSNPFITHEEDMVHIHRLYADFLRTRTDVLAPEDISHSYQVCAAWLQANGFYFEAIDCYRKAGDYRAVWAVVEKLLYARKLSMPSQTVLELCLAILVETPGALIHENRAILLYGAFLQLGKSATAEAKALLARFARLSPVQGESSALQGEYHLLYGTALFIEWDAAFAFHWEKARALMRRSKLIDRDFLLTFITPLFSPESLQVEQVRALLAAYHSGLPNFVELTNGCGAGVQKMLLAGLHYYQGDYAKAVEQLEVGIAEAQAYGQHDTILGLLFYEIHSRIALGQYDEALGALARLQGYSAHGGNPAEGRIMPMADYSLLYFSSLLHPQPFSVPTQIRDRAQYNTLRARGRNVPSTMLTLLAEGQYREALEYMQHAADALREAHNYIPLFHILGLGSWAALQLDMQSYCFVLLEETYAATANGRCTTTLVQAGQRTLDVLAAYRQSGRTGIPAEWLGRVEALCQDWMQKLAEASRRYNKTPPR